MTTIQKTNLLLTAVVLALAMLCVLSIVKG